MLNTWQYLDALEIPKINTAAAQQKIPPNIRSDQNTIESDVFTLKFYSKNINRTDCWLEIVNATQ